MITKVAMCLGLSLIALMVSGSVLAGERDEACVYARDIKQFEILSNEVLLLHGKFDKYWINRLSSRCAGLRKNMIVHIDRYGSQMCANDRFSAQSRGPFNDGPTTSCRFGAFEAVAAEQVVAFKKSLQQG
jgi:hypothetical protein